MLSSETLAHLDAQALRNIANDYEQTARALLLQAARLEARTRIEQHAESAVERLTQSPGLVRRHLDAGMTLDAATRLVARAFNVPAETIASHWRNYLKGERDAARAARDHRILELAELGLSSKAIGREFTPPLAASTVDRIIRRQIEALRTHAPAPTPWLSYRKACEPRSHIADARNPDAATGAPSSAPSSARRGRPA